MRLASSVVSESCVVLTRSFRGAFFGKEYVDWMAGTPAWMPVGRFDIHTSTWDEEHRAATFFVTFRGRYSGEGGPIPPTNREMSSHYVFVLFMSGDDRIDKMCKIWNAHWAMEHLGWL